MAVGGRFDRDWALHASILVLVVLWGLAFVAIKQALDHMSWITLTFLRFLVADAFFLAYLALRTKDRTVPPRRDIPMLFLLAFLGFTGYHLFLNLGEADPSVTAGTAALIIASAPAFIAILSIPVLKERLKPVRAGGIAVAFVGLAIMVLFAHPGSEFRFRASEGALAVLPAAIFAALYSVLGKRTLSRYRPFVFVAYTVLLGTVLLLPAVLADLRGFLSDLSGMGWAGLVPVLFLGILPTFVAYGLWFRALERMPAASAGAYLYLSTLVAVVGGILVLGETLSSAGILGGAMVIAGVVLAQQLANRSRGSS